MPEGLAEALQWQCLEKMLLIRRFEETVVKLAGDGHFRGHYHLYIGQEGTGVPGILALAVISTAFTGQAISTAFDRRYGVLRLLGVSPLGRSGLLTAKALAVLSVEVLQFILIGGLALAFGWHPKWIALLPAALLTLLGTWAFVALALLLAGTMRAEGVLALANLIWICLLGLGGVIVPPSQMPAGLSHVATLLPSGALGDGLRVAFIGGRLSVTPVLVLVVWGAVATTLASRTFSWSD